MTTPQRAAKVKDEPEVFALPDLSESELEEMTTFDHLTLTGSVRELFLHFGEPANAVFMGERYLAEHPRVHPTERRRPDLLIAFNVSYELYRRNNGYIISEQGKPPDFVLEIGSPSTRSRNVGINGKITLVWV